MENSLDATVSSFIEYQNQFSSIIEKLKEGHQNGRFADWKGVITVNGLSTGNIVYGNKSGTRAL